MSKFSDVDIFIAQLDLILKDYGKVSESVTEKIKYENKRDSLKGEIDQIVKDLYVLFEEKERILSSNDPKSIAKKYQNDQKIEEKINKMHTLIGDLELEVKALMKNKKKIADKPKEYYENLTKNFHDQYNLFRDMKNGKIYDDKEIRKFDRDNLDLIIDNPNVPKAPQREMYQEEKDKIENWKDEIRNQDDKLLAHSKQIKVMAQNVKSIGDMIDLNQKMIDKTQSHADKTQIELKKSNKQLKDILEKVGGPTNFCVDVILVCVCLGLCAFLYNIVKNKLLK